MLIYRILNLMATIRVGWCLGFLPRPVGRRMLARGAWDGERSSADPLAWEHGTRKGVTDRDDNHRPTFRSAKPTFERRQRSDAFEERRAAAEGMDFIYGTNPVLNALIARRRASFGELMVQERDGDHKPSSELEAIVRLAEGLNLRTTSMSKHDLNMFAENRPHQGVILTAGPIVLEHLDAVPKATAGCYGRVILALDEVMDPQNFGALIRSASFLGADGVVVCAKNSASPSPVVSKASAGALEIVRIHSTRSMPRFLEQSTANGWRVVGASLGSGSIPLGNLEVGPPTILVLGNEGHGLRTMVQRACGSLVVIEGSGQAAGALGGVDSLNVAVSGGIILNHLLPRHREQGQRAPEGNLFSYKRFSI